MLGKYIKEGELPFILSSGKNMFIEGEWGDF